jgi:hypothetical protein
MRNRSGWTAELTLAGTDSPLAREESRLLFALGVVASLPYAATKSLRIHSKGAVHEIESMKIDNRGSLGWEIDRNLKAMLDDESYASFSRLCHIIVALDGDNYRRLGTLAEALSEVAHYPRFAHEPKSTDAARFSVLRSELACLAQYAERQRSLTVSDREWLLERKEVLAKDEELARSTVGGIALECVLSRLLTTLA